MSSYTGRDYNTILSDLIEFIRATRPDLLSDFTDSNLGSLLTRLMAFVGDTISYGQDAALNEAFLSTCKRYESALAHAKSVGYRPRTLTAASAPLTSKSALPDLLTTYGGIIRAGQSLSGGSNLRYEVLEDVSVSAGVSAIRVTAYEGVSLVDTFPAIASVGRTITTTAGNVAADSWTVFVGDPTDPDNEWTEVDTVLLESYASKTYSTTFDSSAKLIISFGDGTAGSIPTQAITVRYRTCNGSSGNAAAGSINGSLVVDVNDPGSTKASVEVSNYEVVQGTIGQTQAVTGETLPTISTSVSYQVGALSYAPIIANTVQFTLTLPGLGYIVLKDDGAGAFTISSSTVSGYSLSSSQITYSGGGYQFTFSKTLPAGTTGSADYSFFTAADIQNVDVIGAAVGGADRETLEELRTNVPTFMRTQGRLITYTDYVYGIRQIPGVALASVTATSGSYNGNVIAVMPWSSEASTLIAYDTAGTSIGAAYNRYARVSETTVNQVQSYLQSRTLLTVHHTITRPEPAWIDIYLSTLVYDKRRSLTTVRQNIVNAVVSVFEKFSGFEFRVSAVYDAIKSVSGVIRFTIDRVTLGWRNDNTTAEAQGQTGTSASVSGTLANPVVTPGSLTITIAQGVSNIILKDDGVVHDSDTKGHLIDQATGNDVGTVDYRTGVWSATFGATLVAGGAVTATYRDVAFDYRRVQNVVVGSLDSPDTWAPPAFGGVTTDGFPETVSYDAGSGITTQRYRPIQDIELGVVSSGDVNYYDDTYLYNDAITYGSDYAIYGRVAAINARKIVFSMTPE